MNNMKKYNIGISCIGSGVGQSVINSLRLSRLPIKTIGFGTNPFAYGAYDCDEYDYTPTIYQENYIDKLIEKCKEYKVDLIIPGMDDEALIFSNNKSKFEAAGIKAIFSEEPLNTICRDKERMSEELNKVCDVFVKSYDKETLENDISKGLVQFPFIAKPRGGFASKGIEIINGIDDLTKISDEHILQELAIPTKDDPNYAFYIGQIAKNRNPQVSEISIQLVYSPKGELMGRMASYNKLNNGIPIEIVPYENEYVWLVIDQLTPTFLELGLRGPLNIQGRLTENGLKIFEMNPRFTGITGLRALMGFNEVEACVKEWLELDKGKNKLSFNYGRFGMRQTADKSVAIERNQEVADLFKQLNKSKIKNKKVIFITGITGYLGQNLVNELIKYPNFEIWGFGTDKDKTTHLFEGKIHSIYDNEDLRKGFIQFGNVDILLHLGFARPHNGYQKIAESLQFTHELFTRAASHQIPAIINISSQSVYGLETPPLWTEKTPVAPQTVYAQAKYSTELFLKTLKQTNEQLHCSSLRLGTLAGSGFGLTEVDFLSKIVQQALSGQPIKIIGGMQQMERFDVRDAVQAIFKMLQSDSSTWKPIYNVSSGDVNSLIDIAKMVISIASKKNDGKISEIIIDKKEIQMKFGMDSSSFYEDLSWNPTYKIEDTINSLVSYFMKNQKKSYRI
ncbi:NAD-dependent epimerase/dehydratase [Chloroherpeton thalassium ATCC 35110]|uniref:NAD-dependent epimerase/dehydratase n=1 Tax=Chloroherpeton thalassium (strain ATCC 35110 / GB-78) TaxID=517418 RepID=B3QVI6_CHLT3|nr:NAD-dependent epimerase/dehydratase family protein [Chloroherpeton thalassium]ACF14586.1 NAD-dependent epimerase/dehydratase [Chloroherpeton thalassium ATCC 35110]